MKKLIPLEVSSSLSAISADRPLEVTPYANATGVTTEKAPVLISVRSESSVDAEQFAERMRAVGGQGTSAQARLALNAVAVVLGELVEEHGAVTVNTPFGTVQTFIAGTLENATDAPDPETNFAFLGVVVPETYRRQFAKMSAYIPADACRAALKRIRDKATNRQLIDGTNPFYLEGRGLTIGGEGETLELLNAVTREKLCDVSVDAGSKSQVQFLCTLAPQTAIESGEYLVRLMTLAGAEAGSRLWPVELKVEYVAPEPIVFTSATSDGEETGHVRPNSDLTIVGTGLLALRDSTDLWIEDDDCVEQLTFVSVAPDGHSMKVAAGELSGVSGGATMKVCVKDEEGIYITFCEVTVVR